MGVAQTANQLVDHQVNRHQNIRFNGYLGVGARDENGDTKFDNEYDTEVKHSISDAISAFLNAYVDIAKDPYISRGNHNGITSGVTFMLLRAGTPIKLVNRFVGQPILSELTRTTKNSEGITSQELKINDERLKAVDFVRQKNSLDKKEFNEFDVEYFFQNNSQEDLENLISKYNNDGSFENFTNEEMKIQSDILNIFEKFQKDSKAFSASVSASKTPDAGDFAQLMVMQNKFKRKRQRNLCC